MKANRVYEMLISRGGRAPALVADPERTDHIEVVEIASSEVVLFWDLAPREASRLARTLRDDLATLEAEQFIDAWRKA